MSFLGSIACLALLCCGGTAGCAGHRAAVAILKHPSDTISTPAVKGPISAPRPPTSVIEREAEDEATAKALFERLITQP